MSNPRVIDVPQIAPQNQDRSELENPNGPDPHHDPDTGGLAGPFPVRRDRLVILVTLLAALGVLLVGRIL